MQELQAEGIAAGVVQDGAQLMKDPQLRYRNYFENFPTSSFGPMEIPRSALQFRGMTDDPLSLPSSLGQDTDAILQDLLGYDEETINEWKKEGVLS